MLICRARGAWLLVASIALWCWLSTVGLADEFAQTHRREIQEMVAASVKVETGFNAIQEELGKARLGRKLSASPVRSGPFFECYTLVHAKLYARYRVLMDDLNTAPFTSTLDIRKNRSDTSILRDPRKIVVETKYIIASLKYQKDFHPPLEDFVVQYSVRPDLEARCVHDLDVTGMGS